MRHEVIQLSDGWAGTDQTVRTIERLADEALTDPIVVETAHDIVRHLPERDKRAEIRAVSMWVRRHVRYTNESVETIKTPRYLLTEIRKHGRGTGDCDDHVLLCAALHRVLGNKVRFRVISQRADGIASHIYMEIFDGRGWVPDDLIVKNKPVGWEIPAHRVTNQKTYGGMGGLDMGDPGRNQRRRSGGSSAVVDVAAPPGVSARWQVNSTVADDWGMKPASALHVREDGSLCGIGQEGAPAGGGFLTSITSAAAPLASVGKKLKGLFGKRKKKKKAPPSAPVVKAMIERRPLPSKPFPVLPVVAIGAGALLLVFILMKK